ncbi:hypothetical protein MG293_001012 [Ovis ammon polii]|uniref:Uncharacterized protein n=1 Tax=Ovis ammon polii TaxID=230172 RepID=A0AAD4YIG1_OVIAM|nr:hypothetical protein MG293_001012 [Ovis ammon polii]
MRTPHCSGRDGGHYVLGPQAHQLESCYVVSSSFAVLGTVAARVLSKGFATPLTTHTINSAPLLNSEEKHIYGFEYSARDACQISLLTKEAYEVKRASILEPNRCGFESWLCHLLTVGMENFDMTHNSDAIQGKDWKGDPFQGPKLDSYVKLGNELSKEMHMLTKQEVLVGKGTRVENSRSVKFKSSSDAMN